MIYEKNWFLEAIVLVLHIYSCFLQEEQIFKSSKQGRPRDLYGALLRDVLGTNDETFRGRPQNVGQTYFLSFTDKRIKVTLRGYSRL